MNYKFEELSNEELEKALQEVEELEKEMQEYKENNQTIEISKDLDVKMMKMIRKFESIDENKKRKIRITKYLRIVALLFICFCIGMTLLTLNVEAFRIKLFDFIIDDHQNYIDVNIVEKGTLPPAIIEEFPDEWESIFYPMELPKGYKFYSANEFIGKSLEFVNSDDSDKIIYFEYSSIDESNVSINSEECQVKETEINGKSAIYSKSNSCIVLMWTESGYQFVLTAYYLDIKEVIKIAESTRFIKLK